MLRDLSRYSITFLRVWTAVTLAATVYAIVAGFPAAWWGVAFLGYFVYGCLGIVVTFHRYHTHHSFEMHKVLENVLTFIGTLAGTGSSLSWVATHHAHHKHSDTEKDPHAPMNGILRMLALDYGKIRVQSKSLIALMNDPYHQFLHDHYALIHITWSAGLYFFGGLEALLFCHLIPVFLTTFVSVLTNYGGHKWGSRKYNTPDDSRNNLPVALLSFGEGWHNNHHGHPNTPYFGEGWREPDLAYQVIRLIRRA